LAAFRGVYATLPTPRRRQRARRQATDTDHSVEGWPGSDDRRRSFPYRIFTPLAQNPT